MRKLVFWSLIMCLCLGVFVFSGCGGSADTESSDSTSIAIVFDGTWEVIDQEVVVNVDSGDSALEMYLVTASMTFTDTELTETRGLSTITLHESWRIVLDDDIRVYMGIQPVNLDSQVMSMVKSGSDNWRCELFDEYKTVLNIEILAENIIQVTEHRIAVLGSGPAIEYDNVMTFRKK